MTTLELKMLSLQLAAEARGKDEDIAWTYEQAQAIFDWLMEEAVPQGNTFKPEVVDFPN